MTITKPSIIIANNNNSETLGKEKFPQNGQIFIPMPSRGEFCQPPGGGLLPNGGPPTMGPRIDETNDRIK